MNPEQLAETIAGLAADKKAVDVVELDVRGVLGYTDFFLVCSGNTARQTKGIHDGIHQSAQGRPRPAAAPRRGPARGALDPHGLPRRRRAHLHARGARLLPPRAAVGRGARPRDGVRSELALQAAVW